jgi:hypothetical protein
MGSHFFWKNSENSVSKDWNSYSCQILDLAHSEKTGPEETNALALAIGSQNLVAYGNIFPYCERKRAKSRMSIWPSP